MSTDRSRFLATRDRIVDRDTGLEWAEEPATRAVEWAEAAATAESVRAVVCDGAARFIIVLLERTARARWWGVWRRASTGSGARD